MDLFTDFCRSIKNKLNIYFQQYFQLNWLIITYITILYILYNNLDHYPEFLMGDAYTANVLYSHSLIFSKLNLISNLLLRVQRLNVNSYMKEVQSIYKVTDYIVSEIL